MEGPQQEQDRSVSHTPHVRIGDVEVYVDTILHRTEAHAEAVENHLSQAASAVSQVRELCDKLEVNVQNARKSNRLGSLFTRDEILRTFNTWAKKAGYIRKRPFVFGIPILLMATAAIGWTYHSFASGGRSLQNTSQSNRTKDGQDPEVFVAAQLNVAFALHSDRRYNECLPHLEAALNTQPNHTGALNLKASCLFFTSRLAESHATCLKVLELDPKNCQAAYMAGTSLLFLNKKSNAIEMFRIAAANGHMVCSKSSATRV